MAWCMGAAYTAFEGAFEELFDIVDRIDTLSPENPNLHREVHFGGKKPPQSRLPSTSTAGGCQAPRQAAPVPGSPPATDVDGALAFSKGYLFPVRPLSSVEGLSAPCSAPAQRRVGLTTGWRSKTESKTLANALLCGNLKLKFAESSLPRNFSCSDFEKFCQERPWAIWQNSSWIFEHFDLILRNCSWQLNYVSGEEKKKWSHKNFKMLKIHLKRQTKLFQTFIIVYDAMYDNFWELLCVCYIAFYHFSAGVFLERTIPLI